MLPTAFLLAYSLISNLLINKILQQIFGHLAHFRSVIWRISVRSFGRILFGHLAAFCSVVWRKCLCRASRPGKDKGHPRSPLNAPTHSKQFFFKMLYSKKMWFFNPKQCLMYDYQSVF